MIPVKHFLNIRSGCTPQGKFSQKLRRIWIIPRNCMSVKCIWRLRSTAEGTGYADWTGIEARDPAVSSSLLAWRVRSRPRRQDPRPSHTLTPPGRPARVSVPCRLWAELLAIKLCGCTTTLRSGSLATALLRCPVQPSLGRLLYMKTPKNRGSIPGERHGRNA